MFAISLACLVLVVVPIIAVQYPRFFSPIARDAESDTADPDLDGAREKGPSAKPKNTEMESSSGRTTSTGVSAADSKSTTRRSSEHSSTSKGATERPRVENSATKGKTRKPWDPPFATSPKSGREAYRILRPSVSPVASNNGTRRVGTCTTEVEMEKVFEPDVGHVPVTEPMFYPPTQPQWSAPTKPPWKQPNHHILQASTDSPDHSSSLSQRLPTPTQTEPTQHRSNCLSVVKTIALVLLFLVSIFAFAILIAHCLAWFIVYKTESRLGEVRKGLLRGGDMRMCLCAHG